MRRYLKKGMWYLQGGPWFVLLSVAGRFQLIRSVMLWVYRKMLPIRLASPVASASLLLPVDPADGARSLERDGLYLDIRLSDRTLQELRDVLDRRLCYGDGHLELPFYYAGKHEAERRFGRLFTLGQYFDVATACGPAQRLSEDPALLGIARLYFGTEPVFVGMRAWWSFAGPASNGALMTSGQSFHYDLEDYRSMSVFFYFTDVDPAGGPHICIRGSHRRKKLRHVLSPLRTRTQEELVRAYGADSLVPICGRAGFGFVEDTFCFHKGLHPEKHDRLVLQLRFAMRNYGRGSDTANVKWYRTGSTMPVH